MSEKENQLEAIQNYCSEAFHKTNSIDSLFYSESFIERMKCDNKEKEYLINTVKILMDMVSSVRNYGYLTIQNYADKLNNPVAKHIIKLIANYKLPPIDVLRETVMPYLLFSNISGKELLESVLVYECIYDTTVRGIEPTLIEYKLYAYLGILLE